MAWRRYEGRALADTTLTGGSRDAQLEDHIRAQNPHLTDIRLAQATATESYDTTVKPPRRWYNVTYLADDGQGY